MFFFFSSRRRHTICALVPGVQTCALPICTITYNPRDGVFTVSIADDLAGVSREVRFQDPAHRTDFDPAIRPVREVPDLAGFNYLAAADGDNGSTSSFFYQRRSEEHTSDLQSLMRISYAVFCLKKQTYLL